MKSCALLSSLVFFSACSSNSVLKNDLNRLQRSVTDMRSFQSEQTSDIEALRNDLRGIVRRLENLEFNNNKLRAEDSSPTSDLSLNGMKVVSATVPLTVLQEDERFLENSNLPLDVYRPLSNAFRLMRKGDFKNSISLLQEAANKDSRGEAFVQVAFWRGVACEGVKDNLCALSAYSQVVSSPQPNSRKPLALLRQGEVFVKIGDNRTAELTFRKLINDFPMTVEASQAKEKIAELH